jgi:hypothetical protein
VSYIFSQEDEIDVKEAVNDEKLKSIVSRSFPLVIDGDLFSFLKLIRNHFSLDNLKMPFSSSTESIYPHLILMEV